MKSELSHLLDKLKAEKPAFKQLIISHNGRAMAVYGGAPLLFEDLDDLESWLYRPAPAAAREHDQCQCAKCVELREDQKRKDQLPLISEPEPRTSGYLVTNENLNTPIP